MDEKTQKLIWGGQVPVIFNLAEREITSMTPPLGLCMLLPRMSYLSLYTKDIRTHFSASAPPMEDELWFDYNDVPLRWTIPVGTLVDILLQSSKAELPINITVHFQSFPEKKLLRCKNQFTVRSHFLNAFKEALYLKYESSKLVQGLSQSELNQLWENLTSNKYDDFCGIRNKILKKAENETKDKIKYLPVRLFASGFGSDETRFDCKCIQQPVSPESSDGKKHTLESLLKTIVPGLAFDLETGKQNEVEILIQGINPPLDTPLMWLCDNLCFADQFLYITLVSRSS